MRTEEIASFDLHTLTMTEAVELYLGCAARQKSFREKRRIFEKYILPTWGKCPVGAIGRQQVSLLVLSIEQQREEGAPAMARAVSIQLQAFFNWVAQFLNETIEQPCKGAYRPPAPRPRTRALNDREIAQLWAAANDLDYPWGSAAQVALLTGMRRQEVFGLEHDEIDSSAGRIFLSAARTKNGRPHAVPLAATCADIVQRLLDRSTGKLLFPSRVSPSRPLSGFSKGLKALRERAAEEGMHNPDFCFHDLRRTFATGLQRIGVTVPVIEQVLNHVSGTRAGVAGIYQRHDYADEQVAAVERWAHHIAHLPDRPAALGAHFGVRVCARRREPEPAPSRDLSAPESD